MKTILFIETGIGYGGAAIGLLHHLSALDTTRYRAIVVTPRGGSGYDDFSRVSTWRVIPNQLVGRHRLTQICHRVIPARPIVSRLASLADYSLNVMPFALRLARLAIREKVDLILLNNEPVSNMAGVLVSMSLGIPCVSYVKGTLWDSEVSRWLLRRIDSFIAISNFIERELVKQGVTKNRVTVIRDIRNLTLFNPELYGDRAREELGLVPGQPATGIVGLLIPWKGHKVFLEAAARVLADHPNARFFVIGGGVSAFPHYPRDLEEMAARLDGKSRIVFLGQRKDVASVIAGLDIVVHASIEPEPFGTVIIEGMAMGKPVIATNMGGPPEVIKDGSNGFLVPPGDPVALSEKIGALIRDVEVRRAVGKAAREFVTANFSAERDTRRLESIYEEIIRSHRSARRQRSAGP